MSLEAHSNLTKKGIEFMLKTVMAFLVLFSSFYSAAYSLMPTKSTVKLCSFFLRAQHSKNMFYCYVLYSSSLKQFYKGQTDNIQARVQRHNQKTVNSTAHGAPWILCWFTEKNTRAQAMSLEKKLKNSNQFLVLTNCC